LWIRRHRKLLESNDPISIERSKISANKQAGTLLELAGACTHKTISPLTEVFKELAQSGNKVVLDLSGVNVVDGAFIGLCMLLFKYLHASGKGLEIIHLQADVRQIFFWNKAHFLLVENATKES
jgi:N-acetylglucosaminyldiphosphoundecaprenol N-acetyl-beta-D-mannosaminyltransferase